MSNYDFIVNPKTGRKVKLTSTLGKRILNSYVQVAGGEVIDYTEEANDIVSKIRNDMDYMKRFFPDNPDWDMEPVPNTHVFFEGDKVMVNVLSPEVTQAYGASNPGYSNSVGIIIDPAKINLGTGYYIGMFPEQYEDDFARREGRPGYPFMYTNKHGYTIKLMINMITWGEPRDEDRTFREWVETTPELNSYYEELNRMWDESEDGDIYTLNKSTNNIHDVSMLPEAAEPYKRSYLVEWNDNDGSKKISLFSAEALHPRNHVPGNPV